MCEGYTLGKVLLRGPLKQEIYEVLSLSQVAYITHVHPTFNVLHHIFGHPTFSILKQLCSSIDNPISKDKVCKCILRNVNKIHKLPFAISTILSTTPLDYIYTDIWTSHVLSFDGYKYYLIFIDHYTKYI